jgi:sulfate-transporting ATPase
VWGNVQEAVQSTRDVLNRYDEINAKLGEPLDDPDAMEKLLDEQAKVQDKIDALNAWELDRQVEIAMDAMNCRRAMPT